MSSALEPGPREASTDAAVAGTLSTLTDDGPRAEAPSSSARCADTRGNRVFLSGVDGEPGPHAPSRVLGGIGDEAEPRSEDRRYVEQTSTCEHGQADQANPPPMDESVSPPLRVQFGPYSKDQIGHCKYLQFVFRKARAKRAGARQTQTHHRAAEPGEGRLSSSVMPPRLSDPLFHRAHPSSAITGELWVLCREAGRKGQQIRVGAGESRSSRLYGMPRGGRGARPSRRQRRHAGRHVCLSVRTPLQLESIFTEHTILTTPSMGMK